MFNPRPMQAQVIAYTGGKMGVSAVPGSGKTQTLSYLAARLIIEGHIRDDQEVLIVTLVNSAVDNFASRISGYMTAYGLLPDMNYRVRTLHGLANDIIRARPDLVGLPNGFQIADERECDLILEDAALAWVRAHPEFYESYTDPELDENGMRKAQQDWPRQITGLARNFIRKAKDLEIQPNEIRDTLGKLRQRMPLLELGCEVYADYQRSLNYRSAIDFDDLIRLALKAIQLDPDYLARLRALWPYILEDESQDSSRLQEQILRTLSGPNGNWVRVGDPNQAIYETFTTANPRFLLDFLREPDVTPRDLPESGRSTRRIIHLANHLIQWTRNEHPVVELQEALTPPLIRPTPPGDPQPNPPDAPGQIHLHEKGFDADNEIEIVVRSAKKWLEDPAHAGETIAVLVTRNERGKKLAEEMERRKVPYYELLRSSQATRRTADLLCNVLGALDAPGNINKLMDVFKNIQAARALDDTQKEAVQGAAVLLRTCKRLEDYLWPRPERNWMAELDPVPAPAALEVLETFRVLLQHWQKATLLPIDQLILTIAQDLFDNPVDLATAHKMALLLERAARQHPDWRLPEFKLELEMVARNQRKLEGFSEADTGFDPNQHKGEVVIATVHKAKGLEWDRVYLLSVNNYDYPSLQDYDSYISERWYVRNHLNLEAEALAQLSALKEINATDQLVDLYLPEGLATQESRREYAAERLRLLYVGITRARKELVITWNTGKRTGAPAQPALPLLELIDFLEREAHGTAQ